MATSTINLDITAEHAVAVYDDRTGAVVNLHRVIVLRGGRAPTTEESATRAMELTRQLAADLHAPIDGLDRLKALHVQPDALEDGARYRVDVAAGRLVQLPDA